ARMIRLMQAATDPAMLKTPLKMVVQDDETPIAADQALDDSEVLRAITDYEQIETPTKYVAVKELIEKIVSVGGKVVVWATFIHTVLGLKDYLLSCGIACQELYGAIPVEKDAEI